LAALAKLGWKVLHSDSSPWCQALHAKYLRVHNFWNVNKVSTSSGVWSSILATRPLLAKGVRWRIGTNSSLSFWEDIWAGPKPLVQELDSTNSQPDLSLRICDALSAEGVWDLGILHSLLPPRLVDIVRAIPMPLYADDSDAVFWGVSPNGLFTVRSAYGLLRDDEAPADRDPGK